MKIGYFSPSYKRAKTVETHRYVPWVHYVVMKSEEAEYLENHTSVFIVTCPDKVQGNVARVRNWIIDKCMGDNDAIVMLDDDVEGLYVWQNYVKQKIDKQDLRSWVERHTILARDWGAYLWGINVGADRMYYKTNTPFSTTSFVGGPFQVILRGNTLRFDERIPLKEDYDFTLQNVNKYRVVLRVNNAFYQARQCEQAGGCAAYRNMDAEKKAFNALQKKWGTEIVQYSDRQGIAHNRGKSKAYQINPIIRIPIRGV